MKFTLLAAFLAISAIAQVPYERIRDAAKEPQNWLTYSGAYNGQRYSTLNQINAANVKKLQVAWFVFNHF